MKLSSILEKVNFKPHKTTLGMCHFEKNCVCLIKTCNFKFSFLLWVNWRAKVSISSS